MPSYIGCVRFLSDKSLQFFVYNSVLDLADRELFSTISEALVAEAVPRPKKKILEKMYDQEEVVDVMPFYNSGNHGVYFRSRASKHDQVITGPVGAWEHTLQR